jgi:cephalosporin hydroxylase
MDPPHPERDQLDALLIEATDNWSSVRWRGHRLWQNLFDLNVLSEHLLASTAEVVIETGTFAGGSAIFLADMMRLAGREPRVISIDLAPKATPAYPGVSYLAGRSSIDPAVAAAVADLVADRPAFVLLDSDHRAAHVLQELLLYAPFVGIGEYLLVQDGNMWSTLGLPLEETPIGGILQFLERDARFRINPAKSPHATTSHMWGWLERLS